MSLRLETSHDETTDEYIVTLHHPNGDQEQKRFPTLELFRQWLLALEQVLAAERWTPARSPAVLPDTWPAKPPLM
jgi:hypothetical protein